MSEYQKPNLYEFLEVIHYLNAHFGYRKNNEKKFSISSWAKELQVISKVTLRFVLQKKRTISPSLTKAFIENLKLNPEESSYFKILVAYSQSKATLEKNSLGSTLLKMNRANFSQQNLSSNNISDDRFGPIILTLLTFSDLKKGALDIAELLNVDEQIVAQTLSDLHKRDLLKKEEDGTYSFHHQNFRIPDNINLRNFYEYWIDKSKEALNLPLELRKYRSLNFALTEEEFSEAIERINEYSLALLSQFKGDELNGRRLYMLESCLFPISKKYAKNVSEKDDENSIENDPMESDVL